MVSAIVGGSSGIGGHDSSDRMTVLLVMTVTINE